MGCMGYINERLRRSLWYFTFYTAVLVYFGTTVAGGDIIYAGGYGVLISEHLSSFSSFLTIGYIGLMSFYMHSAIWETLIMENMLVGFNYFILVLATTQALYIRWIFVRSDLRTHIFKTSVFRSLEAVFRLSVLISAAHFATELARIVQVLANYDYKAVRVFVRGFFLLTVLIA